MDDRFDDAAREMLREARSAVEEMLDSPRPATSYMHAIRRLDAAETRIADALRKLEKAEAPAPGLEQQAEHNPTKSKALRLCEHIAEQVAKDQHLNAIHAAGELVTVVASLLGSVLKGRAAPAPGLFYIQSKHPAIGNCAMWWAPAGRGCTTDLGKAGLYSEGEANDICNPSHGDDVPWPRELVDRLAVRHVRVEALMDAEKEPDHG